MSDACDAFVRACVWFGSLDRAIAILEEHPAIAGSDIYTAALLGDADAVRRFLALDATFAVAPGGALGWDALTYLCFSKYLRLEPSREGGFLRAATALLDAGASARTGFWQEAHQPRPEFESVLYAAACVARHPGLTRLLLQRGADPNDAETPYHAPEGYDNTILRVLVESGKLTAESLATMLLRKADWHDHEGVVYLLQHGSDPNWMTVWGYTALQQALRRDNGLEIIQALLNHGADATLRTGDRTQTAVTIAARRGRGDVLQLFEQRGVPTEMFGLDGLLAACACDDAAAIGAIGEAEPHLIQLLAEQGGSPLAEFAGNGNCAGVRQLLELGVDVAALYHEGDGYFRIARRSTALHVAAWRAWPGAVKCLLEHGAPVNIEDAEGHTPLALAVRACVDSYWAYRRSAESIQALLAAGADAGTVEFPSGYEEVDVLLRAHRPSG